MRARAATVLAMLALAGCDRAPHATPEVAQDADPTPEQALARPPVVETFDWGTRVGVAGHDGRGRLVLAIPDSLAPGDSVVLVWTADPQRVTRAQVTGRRRPWVVGGDVVDGAAYTLAADGAARSDGFAVAVSGSVGEPAMAGGRVRLDLDGDGEPESFSSCASAEGLHLGVWTGEPREGPQDWHRYVHLGMDLEANCTEVEVGAP